MRGTVSRRGLALAGAAVGVIARVRVDPAAAQPSPAQDGAAPGSPDHAIDIISLDAMDNRRKRCCQPPPTPSSPAVQATSGP